MSDDVLGDLLTALAAALRAGADSQTTFVDAPGCYVLTLTPQHAGRVSLRLMHFARWPAGGAQEGDLIFDQSARLRTFAGSALSVAQAAFKTEGDANYLEKWGTPFPHEAVAKLKAALDED